MKELRPWGYYEVLSEEADHKTKHLFVEAGNRLSYQKHQHRSEHWFIVSGTPTVTIDGDKTVLFPGSSVDIKAGQLHRIEATNSDVVFIEVQTGTYFGEDDIERVEDDYGR